MVSAFSFSLRFLSFSSLKVVLFRFVFEMRDLVLPEGDFGVTNLFLFGLLLFSCNKENKIISYNATEYILNKTLKKRYETINNKFQNMCSHKIKQEDKNTFY
jgi:hypothetical protein